MIWDDQNGVTTHPRFRSMLSNQIDIIVVHKLKGCLSGSCVHIMYMQIVIVSENRIISMFFKYLEQAKLYIYVNCIADILHSNKMR